MRTYRLCQRVLMFHHFADEAGVGNDCLVRSTDFTYADEQDPAERAQPDLHLPARGHPVRLPAPATAAI